MRKYILIALLILLPFVLLAQDNTRQLLRGRVISDSLKVENITVLNVSSRVGAITDTNGEFTIYARPADTLLFSSITFRSLHMVLKEEDFLVKRMVVALDVNVTVLDEVIITPNSLSGNLEQDSRNTETMRINSMFNSGDVVKNSYPKPTVPLNTALPVTESQLQGVSFNKIFDMIFKKKKKKEAYTAGIPFTEAAKERFTHHFFTETLNIPHDEITAFLNFCDDGRETDVLLDPKNEFKLIDYLVQKSVEYHRKKQ